MGYWTNKHVCVTGSCGMIGSHLCELLVKQGARVLALDNLSRGKITNIEHLTLAFKDVDCGDLEGVYYALTAHGIETVFNLAAKVTAIDYNSTHHSEMFYQNMLLQMIPLEASQRAGVTRFVQTSTVCVYPHNVPLPTMEEVAEVNNPEPTNAGYGFAKLLGEKFAKWTGDESGMEIATTRFANAYGERDYFDWETSHVIPALIRKNLENPVVDIWGDGEQRREFLYAGDAALGILKVAELGVGQGAINIGTGSNVSMNELNTMIQDILGVTKPVTHSFEKPTGHRERLADNTKLKRVCNWIPEVTLEEGLEKAITWYRENAN